MKLTFCLLLLGSILLSHTCSSKEDRHSYIQKKLVCIPENERLALEHFFQILVKSDGLGYVLFGNKPVCLSSYFECVPIGNILMGCHSSIVQKGWMVWKKYEDFFSHPEYLIFEEAKSIDEVKIHTVYFVHKEKSLGILKKYQWLFERELGVSFDPCKFLDNVEKEKALLSVLKHHEGLLGILLGYGVESSMNYHKRSLVWEGGLPILLDEMEFQTILEDDCENRFLQSGILPICFAGNPQSSEVKPIIEQYAKERACLLKIYSLGKFLEVTLEKLTMEH